MRIKAVVFDLDDTLISENQYIKSGYHHIAKFLSKRLNKDKEELYQVLLQLLHESPNNVFDRLFDKLEVSYMKHTVMELVEKYRSHFPAIEFYDDVLPCLEALKRKGIKAGVITDGYANAQRQKLKAVRAYEHFDEIIITDELGREYWKPHEKPYELIMEKLDEDYKNMVYVGDNMSKDFITPNKLGMVTVLINRAEGIYSNIKMEDEYTAKLEIKNLRDLEKILGL